MLRKNKEGGRRGAEYDQPIFILEQEIPKYSSYSSGMPENCSSEKSAIHVSSNYVVAMNFLF